MSHSPIRTSVAEVSPVASRPAIAAGAAVAARAALLATLPRVGSVLEIEEENFDPETGRQRMIEFLGVGSKRYVLFFCHQE